MQEFFVNVLTLPAFADLKEENIYLLDFGRVLPPGVPLFPSTLFQ
jgi:hypothetical protein